MMRALAGAALLVLAFIQLAGCGFTLRGGESVSLPSGLQTLYLDSQADDLDFTRLLGRALTDNGVSLAERPSPGVPRLDIAAVLVEERVISVGRDARAGEYELTLSATFSLIGNGEALLAPQTLSTSRIYLADPGNPAAKAAEADVILTGMRRELTMRLLNVMRAADL